jgi:hypothetical protein
MAYAKIFRCNKQTVDYCHETKTEDRWRTLAENKLVMHGKIDVVAF